MKNGRFLGFLVVLGSVFASLSVARGMERLITESELAQSLKLYQKLSHLDVDFTQKKNLVSMGVVLDSSGKFSIDRKTKKMIWRVLKPAPLKVTLTEKQIEIESGEGANRKTQVLKPGEAGSDQNSKSLSGLVSWLNFDAKSLYREYTITEIARNKYRFTPKKADQSPFQLIEMTLASDHHVKTLHLLERSQDTVDIEFGKPRIQ